MEDALVTSMLLCHPAQCPASAPGTAGKVTKPQPQVSALVQVLCVGSEGAALLWPAQRSRCLPGVQISTNLCPNLAAMQLSPAQFT